MKKVLVFVVMFSILIPCVFGDVNETRVQELIDWMYDELQERSVFFNSEIRYLREVWLEMNDSINELIDTMNVTNANLRTVTTLSVMSFIIAICSLVTVFMHRHKPQPKKKKKGKK